MRKLSEEFKLKEKLPKDPLVNKELLRGLGFDELFLANINKIGDLWERFSEPRNRVAHFFLNNDDVPLHFSYGPTYCEYSLAGAVLLHHSDLAFKELAKFFNENLSGKVAKGMILPMKENKDQFILSP